MFSFEVEPAFRGATYIDALQLVQADDGSVMALDPNDYFTWRLFPVDRRYGFSAGYGFGCGWDYGFDPGLAASSYLNAAALVTLTTGAGLFVGPNTIQWLLDEGQTLCLHRPEYRMVLDIMRYGQTARLLDTVLQVMD